MSKEYKDMIVGLDLSPAFAFEDRGAYFPGWADSPPDARALWRLVDRLCGNDAHLAANDDVDGLWYWGSREGSAAVEKLSAGNMKRTWVDHGRGRDWFTAGEGEEFLREATQVKNIWVPYGA